MILLNDATAWRMARAVVDLEKRQTVARIERYIASERRALAPLDTERARETGMIPLAALLPPIRTNEPRAGDGGYEPHSPAPGDPQGRVQLALCVLIVCGITLSGLIAAGLMWRAGYTLWR